MTLLLIFKRPFIRAIIREVRIPEGLYSIIVIVLDIGDSFLPERTCAITQSIQVDLPKFTERVLLICYSTSFCHPRKARCWNCVFAPPPPSLEALPLRSLLRRARINFNELDRRPLTLYTEKSHGTGETA